MHIQSLNSGWRFRRLPGCSIDCPPDSLPEGESEAVRLPHTWYREGEAYRGAALYETDVRPLPEWKRAFLSFGAADQQCRVYVNGRLVGSHRGGYARFRCPIPQEAFADERWRIRVLVDNSPNEDIAPSFGDFTVFGGLYRPVELLVTAEDGCFDPCYFGTDGVIVRAHVDEQGRGVLRAEPHTLGAGNAAIRWRLLDADGALAREALAPAGEDVRLMVEKPALWDGTRQAPLYTLRAALQIDGRTVDEATVRTGFRSIQATGGEGLTLNGRRYALRGVAKHQDRAGSYCVGGDPEVKRDFELIAEMGANAVRLSHYQHPPAAYDCCDELGLLAWAEIPMLKMTESAALMENAEQQLTELILQNIHHPSIFCWGIQNEIAMFRDAPFMHENCRRLHELARRLDPERLTAAANLYPLKASSKLNEITDLVGYNVYFGWYYGEMTDFSAYWERMHAARPRVAFGVTEYGVDANLRLHSEEPRVKDYSEEYQALWHETVYPQIESKPYLWGSFVWNMFDFSSTRRNEGGQRFLNAKGLVSHDRGTRKDAYYYYKARWTTVPFVHLCAKRFEKRARERVAVKCYTNQPSVRLFVNGEAFGEARVENGTAVFAGVPLLPGENRVEARAGDVFDTALWRRVEESEESYRLPGDGAGSAVRNWFLEEDDVRREGFFSIQNTAQELLDNPDCRRVLERFAPALARVMTETSVIPLGLTLKSILSHEKDETLDVQALNKALNQIPDTDP